MGASILTAISRQIWAFSRDNGLPFSSWIKKVNVKLSVPIRAVCFGGFGAILIGLLCLIGPTAANALFTLYIAGNYVAWGTPTFLRLTFGRNKFQPGKFYFGGGFFTSYRLDFNGIYSIYCRDGDATFHQVS